MDSIILALLALNLILVVAGLIVLARTTRNNDSKKALDALKADMTALETQTRRELTQTLTQIGQLIGETQRTAAAQSESRFSTFESNNEQKLEAIRQTVERRLLRLQDDNNTRLEKMQQVVDEKLQKTLESKMTQSFELVSRQLEQVYKSMGEMQTLATGVGDLKKMLSGVKTRGILGEVQLGAILEDILAPEQYDRDVATKPKSRERVEFAVKMPTEDGTFIYLPIDSKFPGDSYAALQDAYENGAPEQIKACAATLTARIKEEAKDICKRYLEPPHTTDYGILFLPFEGLYAEVVNRAGLVEELRRKHHIVVAGPSTMAALLNSLQMGFRSMAIQKRSGEVWRVLGAVRTEFDKFNAVLVSSQKRLQQANADLDLLIGTRTNKIIHKLKNVERMDAEESALLLGTDEDAIRTEDAEESEISDE